MSEIDYLDLRIGILQMRELCICECDSSLYITRSFLIMFDKSCCMDSVTSVSQAPRKAVCSVIEC